MARRFWSVGFILTMLLTQFGIVAAAVYANLSFDVIDPAEYAWFPPFVPGFNANNNDHLGAEYLKIAQAIVDGRGFSDPFGGRTGPTAWMPPILPYLLAGLLDFFEGDLVSVMNAFIVLQTLTQMLTAWLTLTLARHTAPRVPPPVVALLIGLGLASRFHNAFQMTHDTWIVLLSVDFIVAGWFYLPIWNHRGAAVAWGLGGGLSALVSPIAGLCWIVLTLTRGLRRANWRMLVLTAAVSVLTISPWVVRNYVVFGKLIPVKSNLAYELYQSQCLNPQGRLTNSVFGTHPYSHAGVERAECAEMGEIAFLESKRQRFWQSVRANPPLFYDKMLDRFRAATFDYTPMDDREYERETAYAFFYLMQPLPCFAALALLAMAPVRRLPSLAWAGLIILACYLLPYVVVSYYERYEFPLWGVKTLAVVWWLDLLFGGGRGDAEA